MAVLLWSTVSALLACFIAAASADFLTVDLVGSLPSSPAIPPDFASFSLEVPTATRYFTLPNGTVRLSWVNLLNLLRAQTGEAGPNVRIGGGSTDFSAYVPGNATLPANVTYRITDKDIAAYATASPLWNGSLTVGVNFRNQSGEALAAAHVAALGAAIPWSSGIVEALEIGNEVDSYRDEALRMPGYDAAVYAQQWGQFAAAMSAAGLPLGRLQGCTYAETGFFSGLDAFMAQYGNNSIHDTATQTPLRSVSLHEYALQHCNSIPVTVWELLNQTRATQRLPGYPGVPGILPFIAPARALGLRMVIGEGSTASCGGAPGVSDVFASALWALDSLMLHAQAGISRWNFHGGDSASYSPVLYPQDGASPVDNATAQPLFYGMWAFTTFTRRHAVVLNTTMTTAPTIAGSYLSAWAVRDSTGEQRVLLLHKDGNATQPATVMVRPQMPLAGNATVLRLAPAADGILARKGIVYGGLTLDGCPDGIPTGTPITESVTPMADGSYIFTLPVASAALMTLPS